MTRGTTPTLTLTIEDIDLTTYKTVYVTVEQAENQLTKKTGDSGLTVSAHTVELFLTQDETLSLSEGQADVQVRAITPTGEAVASNIAKVFIRPILLEGAIS